MDAPGFEPGVSPILVKIIANGARYQISPHAHRTIRNRIQYKNLIIRIILPGI